MAYIVWKDSFNIGSKEIDDRNKLFASYINELYDAMQAGNVEGVVVPIISKLSNYIQLHFAVEENILKSNNYPMLETHLNQHANFISGLMNLNKNCLLDKKLTAQNMLLFLKDWFLHHIASEDQKYAELIDRTNTEPTTINNQHP